MMISEILLGSASFLLSLFCLICCVKTRKSNGCPPQKRALSALGDRHTVYPCAPSALMIASAVSITKSILSLTGAGEGVLRAFNILYIAAEVVFFLIFALYAAGVYIHGPGRSDRLAVSVLFAVALTGVAIRVFCSVAVELFCENPPGHSDAILMDMRMPVMNGLEATGEIRGLDRPDAKKIPIIAMTANAFEEDVKNCLEAGMNAHHTKPVNIDLLKETLMKFLS